MTLVLGAGAEELLPKFLGVGFPILLTATQFFATGRGTLAATVIFAIAAGAMEDAISMLPAMTSVSFFLAVAGFARVTGLRGAATALTYPCYQLWLAVWTSGLGGGVFGRILLALPVGLGTAFAVGVTLAWIERRGAVHEEG